LPAGGDVSVHERDPKAAGLTMTQYATTWTLKQPRITSAIIGVKPPQKNTRKVLDKTLSKR